MTGLLVDDDALFVRTLQRFLQRRGIESVTAADAGSALAAARAKAFDFALVDLKIGKESGLRLIKPLKTIHPGLRVVMMTGYASVATAVEAIKAGAHDYLLKPVSVDAILRVLTDDTPAPMEESDAMLPLGRLEWEHIQQALRSTDGNISAAARMLGVHRRSLQRKLAKRPAVTRDEEPQG
ncbi:MAG: response regulator [Steroidobacteraceae bacterium]|nr:response regulator [Steroidobacteraceae bacterium]MCW5572348.1 response regulator [Steroidobacteraceae bacterium]